MFSVWQLETPVAFLIFNRPETTKQVFEEIRRARPPKLLVVADGPHPDRLGEPEKCATTRAIVNRVDWPCEVLKKYSDTNLGCRKRISSGLDWVFSNVEEAIILEDDCLPHPTFFRFCEEILERYRDDERVMLISGDNFQFDREKTDSSYYFSCYSHIWGWASWRRAWKHYDVNMSLWPEMRDKKKLEEWFPDKKIARYWARIYEKVYQHKINTWDYQLNFACRMNNGMNVLPNVNLISNIGFCIESTHTDAASVFANMKVEPMNFPLVQPKQISYNIEADAFTEKVMFSGRPFIQKIMNKLNRYLT